MPFCPSCGERSSEGSAFCSACGASLGDVSSFPTSVGKSGDSSGAGKAEQLCAGLAAAIIAAAQIARRNLLIGILGSITLTTAGAAFGMGLAMGGLSEIPPQVRFGTILLGVAPTQGIGVVA